jgi:hypothetical protein
MTIILHLGVPEDDEEATSTGTRLRASDYTGKRRRPRPAGFPCDAAAF